MISLKVKKVANGLFDGTVHTASLPDWLQSKMNFTEHTPKELPFTGEYEIVPDNPMSQDAHIEIQSVNIKWDDMFIEIEPEPDLLNIRKICTDIEEQIDWMSYWGDTDDYEGDA